MLGNLQSPPEPFEDVIKTHFKLKGDDICAQLDKWLQMDDKVKTVAVEVGGGSGRAEAGLNLKSDVATLKALIKRL